MFVTSFKDKNGTVIFIIQKFNYNLLYMREQTLHLH